MTVYVNPFSGRQFLDANGAPYSGSKLFTYVAGSSTKVTTYKDSSGSSQHANPIILNTRGEPADGAGASQAIWQTGGTAIKLVLAPATDTDPPVSAISTWDNLSGINDASVTISEWIAGPTPTYVSATSFTLVGDQTSIFHVGRRLKTTNSGGTIYSYISNAVYAALTTITVVNDSGSLDSGLSAVSYGIVSSTNTSDPFPYRSNVFAVNQYFNTGIGPGYVQNYSLSASVGSNALTITLSAYDGSALSSTNKAQFTFRSATATTGTSSVLDVTANTTLTISSGSTMGTTSAQAARLWIVGFNDSGTFRIGAINCSTSTDLYALADDILASSTAEGGAGAADSAGIIYTGTAVSSKAMRVLGYLEATEATAGTWATTPSKVQLWQPGMKLPGDIVQWRMATDSTDQLTSTVCPVDNTIPQVGEGTLMLSKAITPTSAANILEIEVEANWGGTNVSVISHLHQDAAANALRVTFGPSLDGTDQLGIARLRHIMVANTTSSTTFGYYAGLTISTNTHINANTGTALFNGTSISYLKITERMG